MVFGCESSFTLIRYYAMYILWLSSSWGTSRICPAWFPSEHQLTPALSPLWGLRPKPHRPEEVVYSPNDSYSHFTQRLFPPKLPRNIHELFLTIHSMSFISIVHHIHASNYIFYLHNIFTLSFLQIFMAGWLPSVPCVRCNTQLVHLFVLEFAKILNFLGPSVLQASVANLVMRCGQLLWFRFAQRATAEKFVL